MAKGLPTKKNSGRKSFVNHLIGADETPCRFCHVWQISNLGDCTEPKNLPKLLKKEQTTKIGRSLVILYRSFKRLLALSALALVVGCAQNNAIGVSGKGQPFPPGVDTRQDAIDGLTVGHRLMSAGEYELALKAYYRAASEHGLDVDTLSAIGSANLKLGRLGQAEDSLRDAITLDETFAPAWNNLGVVLMESGQDGEASRVFRTAYALDSGETPQIRENLRLALAKLENPGYYAENNNTFALVRRGGGEYRLQSKP